MNCKRCNLPFTSTAWPGMNVPVCRCGLYRGDLGRIEFAPNPPDKKPGAQVLPFLTEADVRRIVAEELAKLGGGITSTTKEPKA